MKGYILLASIFVIASILVVASCEKPTDSKPADSKPADPKLERNNPAGSKPADSELVEGKTISFAKSEENLSVEANFTTEVNSTDPTSGDDKGKITYKSSNPEVASVDPDTGAVTALKAGQTTITATKAATPNKYRAHTASYRLVVTKGAGAQLSFSSSTVNKTTAAGESPFDNPAAKSPSPADDNGDVTYTSSVPEVAGVDGNGQVTILKAGTTVISATKVQTAKYEASSTVQYTLTVTRSPGKQLTIPKPKFILSLGVGDPASGNPVRLSNTPSDDDGAVTYSSDNTSVATVDPGTGAVTPLSAGGALISATKAQSDKYSSHSVTYGVVVDPSEF